MEELIKINHVINNCLNYRAVKVTDDNEININYNFFSKNLVNEKGEFIGQKYKRFLWIFKVNTHQYQSYLWSITECPVTMSYRIGNTTYLSAHIESVLNSAMELDAYKNDAKVMLDKFKLAWENLEVQYEVLANLKRINNINQR